MNDSTPQKKFILIAAGSPEFDNDILKMIPPTILQQCFVIAVDKGLDFLEKYGLLPDVILGDFDSVSQNLLKKYDNIQKHSYPTHKDKSDGEIAVEFALNRNPEKIFIINAIGGRLDHDLFSRLLLLHSPGKIWLISSHGCMTALSPHIEHHFPLKKGSIFSLIPLTICTGVTISGCEYPLKNQDLSHSTLTLSNLSSGSITLEFSTGNLLFFIEKPENFLFS